MSNLDPIFFTLWKQTLYQRSFHLEPGLFRNTFDTESSNFPSDYHVHKAGHWKSNQNDLFTKSSLEYKISCKINIFSFWLISLKVKGSVIKGLKSRKHILKEQDHNLQAIFLFVYSISFGILITNTYGNKHNCIKI